MRKLVKFLCDYLFIIMVLYTFVLKKGKNK